MIINVSQKCPSILKTMRDMTIKINQRCHSIFKTMRDLTINVREMSEYLYDYERYANKYKLEMSHEMPDYSRYSSNSQTVGDIPTQNVHHVLSWEVSAASVILNMPPTLVYHKMTLTPYNYMISDMVILVWTFLLHGTSPRAHCLLGQ